MNMQIICIYTLHKEMLSQKGLLWRDMHFCCKHCFAYNIPKGLRGGLEGRSHSKYQYAAVSKVGLLFKQGGRDCRGARAGQHHG